MLGNYFIPSPPASTLPSGSGIAEAIASEPIQIGQPIYLNSGGNCSLASATGFPQCQVVGIAINSVGVGEKLFYSPDTMVGHNDWSVANNSILLTMGTTYYLSETPGNITASPPNTEFKIQIGRAISNSILEIEIEIPTENIYEAAANIAAYKVVGLNSEGKLILADSTLQILPIGIILKGVSTGEKTIITIQKPIYNLAWNWLPNKKLFLAENGDISTSPATVGVFAPIGRSISDKQINFDATLEYYYLAS